MPKMNVYEQGSVSENLIPLTTISFTFVTPLAFDYPRKKSLRATITEIGH